MRVYLAGAVDNAPDWGRGWRKEASKLLNAAGLVPMYPPALSPGVLNDADRILANNDFLRTCIIAPNVLGLLECDIVLVRVCPQCGYGTLAELALALWARLPVVVVRCVGMGMWRSVFATVFNELEHCGLGVLEDSIGDAVNTAKMIAQKKSDPPPRSEAGARATTGGAGGEPAATNRLHDSPKEIGSQDGYSSMEKPI